MPTSTLARLRPRLGGFERIAAITATLVGTQAATSFLGFLYWTIAARSFSVSAIGFAGAATSAMQMLGSVGMLGLGTLMIAQLAKVAQSRRRLLMRTTMGLVAAASLALGLLFALAADFMPVGGLRLTGATPINAALFAIGVSVTGVTLVLDQAVLAIGSGGLQLERNIVASTTKIFILLLLSYEGRHGGMAIYLSWTLGTIVSLALVGWRTRVGHQDSGARQWFSAASLRGYGRAAASHHLLNLSIQAPVLLLSPLVAIEVSTTATGYFSTVVLVAGFVFVLPFAMSVGLFAASAGDEQAILSRMRVTVPVAIVVSLSADVVLYLFAPLVLGVFGSAYATHGVTLLRLIVLAGLPFVIKDHYVALRRVQNRTGAAARLLLATTILEVIAAAVGAKVDGTMGLSVAWLGALTIEAAILAVPLRAAYRSRNSLRDPVLSPPEDHRGGSDDDHETVALVETVPLLGTVSILEPDSTTETAPLAMTSSSPVVDEVYPGDPHEDPVPRHSSRPRSRSAGPVFFLASVGLLLEAFAAVSGRDGRTPWEVDGLYWAGLVVIFVPAAAVVLSSRAARHQRRFAVITLALALQLSRLVLYPLSGVYHDELAHVATLRVIERTHHFFGVNPLLPVSSYYPGLETAAASLHALLGVPDRVAVIAVLLLARVVITLSLLLIFERLGRSDRFACLAVLLYACNEQYLFFNSQFSYQTLALPLAVLTVYALLRQTPLQQAPSAALLANRRTGWGRLALPLLFAVATAVTHHLTSMLLVVALMAWWVAERRMRRVEGMSRVILLTAAITAVFVGAWMAVPGNPVAGYLSEILNTAAKATKAFLTGKSSHALFSDASGYKTPVWEVVVSLGSEVVVFVALLVAVWHLWKRRRTITRPLAVLLVLAACAYPIVPAGHFSTTTSEVTDRASGFLFIGVAFVVAWWMIDRRRSWLSRRTAIVTAVVGIVFVGQMILGSGPQWAQTPGTFLVSADSRSLDSYNLAVARWSSAHLAPGTRVLADRDGSLLAGSVGGLYPVSHIADGINASQVLLARRFSQTDVQLIRRLRIQFVIVDVRDAEGLPREGVYYESGEYDQARKTPVSVNALTKLSRVPGVQRLYSNGPVSVYDVRIFDVKR